MCRRRLCGWAVHWIRIRYAKAPMSTSTVLSMHIPWCTKSNGDIMYVECILKYILYFYSVFGAGICTFHTGKKGFFSLIFHDVSRFFLLFLLLPLPFAYSHLFSRCVCCCRCYSPFTSFKKQKNRVVCYHITFPKVL
jgi:hypothetical protein